MPYDWIEFLALARFLQTGAGKTYTEQAALRSAVGRAYYAAFNHACVYAETRNAFTRQRDAGDHERLRQHFQIRGNTEIASQLDDLRRWRNACDYDDTRAFRVIKLMVEPALKKAQEIIESLNQPTSASNI
jgi:uncharacterized protein (UPF0332 family)